MLVVKPNLMNVSGSFGVTVSLWKWYVPTQPATKKICTALAYIHIHCQM